MCTVTNMRICDLRMSAHEKQYIPALPQNASDTVLVDASRVILHLLPVSEKNIDELHALRT